MFDTEFTETSDNVRENKTSIIINETDDKVVVGNGLVTGAIIVISTSDKLLPRWMVCISDRERE
jgi:hypothetical protein